MVKQKQPHFDREARSKWYASRIVKREGRMKYMTGFCANGYCEGTKPVSASGKPVSTCRFFDTCPCVCHAKLDQMFELAEEPRVLQTNPDFKPVDNRPLRKMLAEIREEVALSRRLENSTSKLPDAFDPELSSDSILSGEAFKGTDSGIRARGQLEYQVFTVCSEAWASWPTGIAITPKLVAECIAAYESKTLPSTGAIQAVWVRWSEMGFASFEKKPIVFSGFNDFIRGTSPTIGDLEKAKMNHKGSKRRGEANTRRNTIRGARK